MGRVFERLEVHSSGALTSYDTIRSRRPTPGGSPRWVAMPDVELERSSMETDTTWRRRSDS